VANKSLKPLKQESDFRRLKAEGQRFRLESWLLVLFIYQPSPADFLLGFSLSSRFLNSVKRNRVKRVFRESLRPLMCPKASFMVHIIVTRKVSDVEWQSFYDKKSSYYHRALSEVFKRCRKRFVDFKC
jgi:ribonuclease P protein component